MRPDPRPTRAQLDALERVAVDVATSAAALIVDERPTDLGVAHTKSTHTDVVTVMDQRAQDHLLARLAELAPHDAVMGEEQGGAQGESGLTWVVDPIDGTVNYLYDLPAYAVSVAVVTGDPTVPGRWTPLAGAVVNAVTGECFRASRGGGAHRRLRGGRDRRLGLRPAPRSLGEALVATGFGYAAEDRRWQAQVLTELLPRVRDLRRLGSAALDLCRLAAGEVDAYYESGLKPWDLAAGWLVATEAGAVVGGAGGSADPPSAELVWATSEGLADAFGDLVTGLTAAHRAR